MDEFTIYILLSMSSVWEITLDILEISDMNMEELNLFLVIDSDKNHFALAEEIEQHWDIFAILLLFLYLSTLYIL